MITLLYYYYYIKIAFIFDSFERLVDSNYAIKVIEL